ncbi:MopE-related protein [Flavobacteriaceae bacterium MJ-SS4]|uniref:MopE-related protein n=1 Tax=Gilvirhabdus luticola TaxID=3079858 RepID=UPI0032DD030E
MRNITLLAFTLLFSLYTTSQDCTSNNDSSYSYMAMNNGFIEEASQFVQPGEYMTLTNILANDYTFTANHTVALVVQNDYITISNTSNTILAQGESPLSYTFATPGTYRIHVSLNDLCETDTFNVTVSLLNETIAPTTCQMPENPTVSYRSDTRIDFSWDPPSVGDTPSSYDWEAVPNGSSQGNGGNPSGNVMTTSASATGLTPSTSYTIYIRSKCGVNGDSEWWIAPFPLSTNAGPPPENDICTGATLIIQDTGKDVNSATVINATLLNTAQTDVDPENCDSGNLDNARDDVWYKFIAQTTDINITLNTPSSLFNGVLSLFSDCDESSYLACSDVGTGNTEEQISYNSLVVGQTYYFRVWHQGFATSSPSFTLKLWSPTVVADADGDGYSDPTDCDDGDPNINPSATEVCDGQDNDCDGDTDDADSSIVGQSVWYEDSDGDNYGNPSSSILACNQPVGYVSDNTDCNDSEAASYPGNTEICDGIDNDCDGLTDDADPSIAGQTTWYEDSDSDNYGNPSSSVVSCNQPGGYVSNNLDCNDSNSSINPDATEVCDGVDNDCDGNTDDADSNIVGQSVWYEDSDGDNYGNPSNSVLACNQPGGYVSNNLDCDDGNPSINPDATEVCDGIDNDCDGDIDDADASIDTSTQSTYYLDFDGDGFGDEGDGGTLYCNPPSDYVLDNTDCDDTMDTVYPGAPEIINDGIDQDCDGSDATLGLEDFDSNAFSYYFNSDRSILTINSFGEPFDNLKMYNLLGKLVMDKDLSGTNENINLSFLSEKLYVVRISIQNKVTYFKIIK